MVLAHQSQRVAQDESNRQTSLLLREIELHRQTDAALQLAKQAVAVIKRGGAYLLSLIEGTLDLAHIESGRLTLSLRPLAFADFMQDLADMFVLEAGPKRLSFRLHQQIGDSEGGGDWLIIMQEVSDESVIEAMGLCFKPTSKEAEVLYWVVKGKINRDIGGIVGFSWMTVKKHLEHVFAKLGVETRTAAAAMAMRRVRQLQPQFEA